MRKGVIAFFVATILVLGFVVMTLPQATEKVTVNTTVEAHISPEDKDVQQMFLEIHEMPYVESGTPQTVAQFWTNGYGDCDDKARAFADYLDSNGEKVRLGKLTHQDGYGHTYVIWREKVYDPTTIDPKGDKMMYYGVDEERFLKTFELLGFTGMRSSEPYLNLTPELCEMMSR